MQDALRNYLGLAMGLSETSRKRVRKVVKEAVGRSNATADQVKAMTSDLLAANSANRDALVKLVKFEVDRALGVVGLATAEEVAELTGRLHTLEAQLRAAGADGAAPTATAPAAPTRARASASRSTTTRATAAKAGDAEGTAAKKAPAKTAATKTTATKAAPAKKATAAKATAARGTSRRTTTAKAQP